MTEADEKLSRLFQADAPERDTAFVGAVETRLRRLRMARLLAQALMGLALVALMVAAWISWRITAPLLADAFGPLRLLDASFLGAPAPVLGLFALAGLWLLVRRLSAQLAYSSGVSSAE